MKTLVTPALLAGLLAALILTLVQILFVTPLIIEAETYENAVTEAVAITHSHDDVATSREHNDHSADHHHDEEAWAPEDGWQRTLSTASANLLMGVGYGLILVALYRLRHPQNLLTGLVWGAAGYATVFLAPALGLHPELPGTAAAELSVRVEWWIGTAIATASGLALCALAGNWLLKGIGLLLIALPHLIGAPLPAIEEALAPQDLQHRFILASALANAVFWLSLGLFSTWLYRRANTITTASDALAAT